MLELSYNVRFSGKLITLPKTQRDIQWEKMHACLWIIKNSQDTGEISIAKAIARQLKTALEKGYK